MNGQSKTLQIAEELESLEATLSTCGAIHQAAFELRRLHSENERLREENVYLKEAFSAAANRIEKLAFQISAPNKQTPEFMMLAISIRKIVQEQEQPR